MDENAVNEVMKNEQVPESTGTNTAAPKKRIIVGYIILGLVPAAILMMIQTIAQIPFLVLAAFNVVNEGLVSDNSIDNFNTIISVFNERYSIFMYALYGIAGIIVFGIWYFNGFVKKEPKVKLRDIFGVRSVVAVICLVISLNFVIDAMIVLIRFFIPSMIQQYNELIEMSGLVTDPWVNAIYTVTLAPILEELCFRGVSYKILEKSGIKPGYVILITSVVFGAIHMIPLQVTYAIIIALFLAFLRYRYRSILVPLLAHIMFNVLGSYLNGLIEMIESNDAVTLIIGGISMFVVVFSIVLINGDKKAYRPAAK